MEFHCSEEEIGTILRWRHAAPVCEGVSFENGSSFVKVLQTVNGEAGLSEGTLPEQLDLLPGMEL